MRYKISVAIITYNQEDYIGRALESVLNQQISVPIEVVIGDDASTDQTSSICQNYADMYPDIVKHHRYDANIGFINNLLSVINKCSGEYIALLEADDYWVVRDKLAKQLAVFTRFPKTSICFTNSRIDNSRDPNLTQYFYRDSDMVYKLEDVLSHVVAPTSSYMFKREAFNPPAWFSQLAAYEYYLMYMVAEHGEIYYLNECTSLRTQHYRGLSSIIKQSELFFSQIKFAQNLLDSFKPENRRRYQNQILQMQINGAYHLLLNLDKRKAKMCLKYISIYRVRFTKGFTKILHGYLKFLIRM